MHIKWSNEIDRKKIRMTEQEKIIYETGKFVGQKIGLVKGILIGCLGVIITILIFILWEN